MSKLRVGVLRGGPSNEHEVSLKTGAAMLKYLPEDYARHDLFVDKDGLWHIDGFHKQPEDILRRIDVVLNGAHGQWGEDGKLQRLLETLRVPYTGSNSFSSALGMNKHISKEYFKKAGIQTPESILITENDLRDMRKLFTRVAPTSVIKPNRAGSSVGVRLTKSYADMEDAIRQALEHDSEVLVEELISGREATVGVIDGYRGEETYVLPVIEIAPAQGWYDYEAKYESDETGYVCPGRFSESERDEMRRATEAAHKVLGLRHYSRADFIVHPKRGPFLLEINTLPGMTSHSLIPKGVEAVGGTFSEFLDHLVKQALKK